MNLTNFYTFQYKENPSETEISAMVEIVEKHQIFEGHFPQHPIVPGVALLQIIKEVFEKKIGVKVLMKEISMIKFLSLVMPGRDSKLYVVIKFEEEEERYKINSQITFQDKTLVLKCSGIFVP